jgi:hypothetical protein
VKRLPPTADLTPDAGRDSQGIDERRIEGEDGQVVRHTEVSAAAGADLTLQRGLQVHGLADWQPQPQVDGVAAGVRQPQVQDAPMQGLQAQGDFSVFIWRVPGRREPEVATANSLGISPL